MTNFIPPTRECLDFSSMPPQRKSLWRPWISLIIYFGADRIEKRYIDIACRTTLTKTKRLGRFRGLNVQLMIFLLILSINSCQDTFLMVPSDNRASKDFDRREPLVNPKIRNMFLWVTLEELKKKTCDFLGFTLSPDALAKRFRLLLKARASWT